jgi:hypothetical protein
VYIAKQFPSPLFSSAALLNPAIPVVLHYLDDNDHHSKLYGYLTLFLHRARARVDQIPRRHLHFTRTRRVKIIPRLSSEFEYLARSFRERLDPTEYVAITKVHDPGVILRFLRNVTRDENPGFSDRAY